MDLEGLLSQVASLPLRYFMQGFDIKRATFRSFLDRRPTRQMHA